MDDVKIDVDKIQQQNKANEELQFQDIPHDMESKVQTHTFTDFPHTAESDEEEVYDKQQLLKEDKDKPAPSFWTFEYYQQFFDVETHQVLGRILASFVPRPNTNYIKDKVRPNPDLYGPFWICTTLVFTTAIAGNLANYLGSGGKEYQWKYDFHKVTFAATAIFSYWWLVPTGLFGLLWWRGSQASYTFLEILCVYGYSLAIYIPISILWTIPFDWLRWILVIVGALLSGGVLIITFWPAVKEDNKRIAWAIIVGIFLFHALLAVGFKMYFFNVPVVPQSKSTTVAPITTKAPNVQHQSVPLTNLAKSRVKSSVPSSTVQKVNTEKQNKVKQNKVNTAKLKEGKTTDSAKSKNRESTKA